MATTFERVTADELRPGDLFASTRNEDELVKHAGVHRRGERSAYINITNPDGTGGARIRPRYTTKFWRVVR